MDMTLYYRAWSVNGEEAWDVALTQEQEKAYARTVLTGADPRDVPEFSHLCAQEYPKIERMLTELLSNAVSHSMPGSAVTLALDVSDGEITLRVSDSGSGGDIEPGLGLTSAEYIARLHGGSLRVEASPEGTTATVTLPADRSELIRFEAAPFEYASSAQSRLLTGLSRVLTYRFYMPPYL